MLKLPLIVTIFIVLVTAVMMSYNFQQVSAQVSNSTTTNSTSVAAITVGGKATGGIAYDPIHHTMYVSSMSANTTSVINTTTLRPLPVLIPRVGHNPTFIAYDPIHHTMYVASASGNTVSVINTTTNSVIGNPIQLPPSRAPTLSGNVSLFNGLFGITYDPIHKTMYVANIEPNTVSVINTTTNSVIGSPIPAGKQPQIAAYDPIHKTMYMTNIGQTGCTLHVGCVPAVARPSTVTVINTTTNSVIGNIPVGLDPFGIAYDPIHHTMYVANSGSNTVSIINTTTNSVIANPVTGNNNATGIAYEPIHHRMYMTHNHDMLYSYYKNWHHKGSVTAISTAPPYTVIGRPVPADVDPFLIAYDPLHQRMYVTYLDSDKVSVIDVK
jgi:YVTN family beta-propeller protein